MADWKLKRTRQCKKCPWRKSVNPRDIPNGYSVERHKALENTIAKGSALDQLSKAKNTIMACHESHDAHCLGWLNNQLHEGNNIMLRLKMISCTNSKNIKLVGEQHKHFRDTLPTD